MTAAAIAFYLLAMALGFERLRQLKRPYPALTSLGFFSIVFAVLIFIDRI